MAISTPVSFWNVNESSGNAADAVGSNTLTNNNTITYVAGLLSNCADLESSSTMYFSISDASQTGLDITGDISISAWVNPESLPAAASGDGAVIMAKYNATTDRQYLFRIYEDGYLSFTCFNGADSTDGTTASKVVSTGSWQHVGVTWDSATSTAKIYYNGSQSGSSIVGTNTSIQNGTAAFTVGRRETGGGIDYYDGKIDAYGIWGAELTSSEMTELYNAGVGVEYPFPTTTVKTVNGLANASVKTVNGLARASVKTINGLA